MSEPTPPQFVLPEGDTSPETTYIAVARAIHAWEGMEAAMARLCLRFSGIDDTPNNLAEFGFNHRRFTDRKSGLERAAESYFVRNPDQAKEGEFRSLIAEIEELAIERHRIAHGHLSMVVGLTEEEIETATNVPVTYRWAAPFYSVATLRTDPFGKGSKDINALTDTFMRVHDAVFQLTLTLPEPTSR